MGNFLWAMFEGALPLLGYGVMAVAFGYFPWMLGKERKQGNAPVSWGERIYFGLQLLGASFAGATVTVLLTEGTEAPKAFEHQIGVWVALLVIGWLSWLSGVDTALKTPSPAPTPVEPEPPTGVVTHTTRFRY